MPLLLKVGERELLIFIVTFIFCCFSVCFCFILFYRVFIIYFFSFYYYFISLILFYRQLIFFYLYFQEHKHESHTRRSHKKKVTIVQLRYIINRQHRQLLLLTFSFLVISILFLFFYLHIKLAQNVVTLCAMMTYLIA